MTANQINYWKLKEEERSNVAKETETKRSNLAKEFEANRTNVANELLRGSELVETITSHRNQEAENIRYHDITTAETERSARAKLEEEHIKNRKAAEAKERELDIKDKVANTRIADTALGFIKNAGAIAALLGA